MMVITHKEKGFCMRFASFKSRIILYSQLETTANMSIILLNILKCGQTLSALIQLVNSLKVGFQMMLQLEFGITYMTHKQSASMRLHVEP